MRIFQNYFSLLLLAILITSNVNSLAQSTLIIQPDSIAGKDAFLDSRLNNANFGDHPDFASMAWTNGGQEVDVRSLLQFDLSCVPAGAVLNSAKLSLYSYTSKGNGAHSTTSGSNTSYLFKVDSKWDESTVTWNNQPGIDSANYVILEGSTSDIQDYSDIDVTALIADLIANPVENHGIMIKLVTEEHYRKLIFGSSDNDNPALRPKLELSYSLPTENKCVVFRPQGCGKDAFLDSKRNDENFGDHPDFASMAWTNGGAPVNIRSLIEFDLAQIPDGATIDSAKLSLYGYTSAGNGAHSTSSGSNESVIQRVTQSWDEHSVTWDTQPKTTSRNQLSVKESNVEGEDYLDLDVTNLVTDLIDSSNGAYGLMIKLVTEDYYRKLIFASSDNDDQSLHPKLEVCYSVPSLNASSFDEKPSSIKLYPNPSAGIFNVTSSTKIDFLTIYDQAGQLVKTETNVNSTMIAVQLENSGVYFIEVQSSGVTQVLKAVVVL